MWHQGTLHQCSLSPGMWTWLPGKGAMASFSPVKYAGVFFNITPSKPFQRKHPQQRLCSSSSLSQDDLSRGDKPLLELPHDLAGGLTDLSRTKVAALHQELYANRGRPLAQDKTILLGLMMPSKEACGCPQCNHILRCKVALWTFVFSIHSKYPLTELGLSISLFLSHNAALFLISFLFLPIPCHPPLNGYERPGV